VTETGGVLTVGETMALVDPDDGPIRPGLRLMLRIAGAESNFAVGLARLGVPARWVSRLGRDPFGEMIVRTLAAEGVDISFVRRDRAPTGLFFKYRLDGRTHLQYYRAGSAASRLQPRDVPDEALDGVALVHLTGITIALGRGPAELVFDLARRARARGSLVLFDPNYREALWKNPHEAAQRQRPLLEHVDYYLCGLAEGNALWGTSGEAELAAAIPVPSVVRLGPRGALVAGEQVRPARIVNVVDEVGAGDAFAAGFAYGLLQGWPPRDCTRAGNFVAAAVLGGLGDWETLPRLEELKQAIARSDQPDRAAAGPPRTGPRRAVTD
jgi:2-dehydro-3-deoxygluconokinase